MKFGLTENELNLLNAILIQPLKKNGAKVWIFGSRARGDQDKFSDIDLLFKVKEGNELPKGLLFDLKTQIEDARIPYKVDLVNDKDLAPSYRSSVYQDKIIL
jgi:predicted nucleotidyltransferase